MRRSLLLAVLVVSVAVPATAQAAFETGKYRYLKSPCIEHGDARLTFAVCEVSFTAKSTKVTKVRFGTISGRTSCDNSEGYFLLRQSFGVTGKNFARLFGDVSVTITSGKFKRSLSVTNPTVPGATILKAKAQVSGKLKGSKASGKIRVSVLIDERDLPPPYNPSTTHCDSGTMSWSAKLR